MSKEQNIAIYKKFVQAYNDKEDIGDIIQKFFAPNTVRYDLNDVFGQDWQLGEDSPNFGLMFVNAIPDMHLGIEKLIATEDGHLTAHLIISGTHQGKLLGVEPTGKPIKFNAVNMYRFEQGKLVVTWQLWDLLTFVRQIGAVTLTY